MSLEEEMQSTVSTALNVAGEGSDSNSSNNPCAPNKRQRQDNTSFARFKGVVLQQNGHWGAQIYANHQRIWLGTFKSEKEAAMAYDSAAIKVRSGDSHRNYPWTNLTVQEPNFQNLYSTDAILNMIKDGSYQSKFLDFVKARSLQMDTEACPGGNLLGGNVNGGGYSCQQLFQKELTPSDVGKLNRLVIPKKYAVKYFRQVSELGSEEEDESNGVDEVQLEFYDDQWRLWKFRYCYWKSSQSFVFTRGWNRFVKEKGLKAKDVITFFRCEYRGWLTGKEPFDTIRVAYNGDESNSGFIGATNGYVERRAELNLAYGTTATVESESSIKDRQVLEEEEEKEELVLGLVVPPPVVVEKGFKLFGVIIS